MVKLDVHMKPVTTMVACNLGPLSSKQQRASLMAFRWRGDCGPLLNANWADTCFDICENPSKIWSHSYHYIGPVKQKKHSVKLRLFPNPSV